MRWLLAAALALTTAPAHAEDNWPCFLGGRRAGASAATLPASWDAGTNVLWKADVPGEGWSSPVVWGGRVFLTSAVSDTKRPAPRQGLYINDLQGKAPAGEYDWRVHCLDARTGKVHWQRRLPGGYSASPVYGAGHLYFQSEDGVGTVLEAGKTFRQVSRNEIGERTLASYAVADGAIFLRGARRLYRIGK